MFESWKPWYDSLAKPLWTPAPATISTIWFILYPIITVSFVVVVWMTWKKKLPHYLLVIFSINLIANLLFSPIFFGLQNLSLATLDILIVLGTIIAEVIFSWRYNKWLSVAQIPYLVWVSTATFLQISILVMNI